MEGERGKEKGRKGVKRERKRKSTGKKGRKR